MAKRRAWRNRRKSALQIVNSQLLSPKVPWLLFYHFQTERAC